VSSPSRNLTTEKAPTIDWARLIPGEAPSSAGKKKGPRSVRPVESSPDKITAIFPDEAPPRTPVPALGLLVPRPLQTATAWTWACSTAADFALVALNWLLTGALLVPLRLLFPQVHVFTYAAGSPGFLVGIALLNAALITLLGYTEGLYEAREERRQAQILGKSTLLATTLLVLAYGLQGATWAADILFGGIGGLNFAALCFWRRQSRKRQRRSSQCGRDLRNVLIVGAGGTGQRIAAYAAAHPEAGRAVCGVLDDERPLGDGVVGRIHDLPRLARTGFVDEVILAAPQDRKLTWHVLHEARRLHLNVEIVPDLFGCRPADSEIQNVADLPLIPLHAERLPAASLVLKRLVDFVGALFALTVLSPLLALIAIWIRLDSSGPSLYCALRAGRKGRPFRCFKFRTMVADADALKANLRRSNQRSGPFFKIANDPRITRVGSFLRRYSLDELPQLWNVLRGEMSLVGPRPHPLDDLAGYEIEHLARLDVTPGLTGLWQVTARRDPSFERGMELDRHYIRTWSLTSDLRILLQTVLAVARGSGD
jgi:exopolysaccharide biosynthesis polyprenyl glycosylphosphotransferase